MMKKGSVLLIVVMSISILLIGCSIGKKDMNEDFGFEKAHRIEVLSEGNPSLVLKKIDSKEEIIEFVRSLKVDKWVNEDTPTNAEQEYIYEMYQEDTHKPGDSQEKKLEEIATVITYKNSPYISFTAKELNVSFKVPEEVAKELSKIP
ncbi:hypothetical protein CHH83_18510 [Bacillus sp. 7586-K]|nr:hypothetical protein CHH83_18510 [Bacillus sp. 7586-K]